MQPGLDACSKPGHARGVRTRRSHEGVERALRHAHCAGRREGQLRVRGEQNARGDGGRCVRGHVREHQVVKHAPHAVYQPRPTPPIGVHDLQQAHGEDERQGAPHSLPRNLVVRVGAFRLDGSTGPCSVESGRGRRRRGDDLQCPGDKGHAGQDAHVHGLRRKHGDQEGQERRRLQHRRDHVPNAGRGGLESGRGEVEGHV
mmetsp:Transcript_28006/g.82304  ORF Transcript_28006/g.82304 Transcript_28006/m.82304 type:complete len:201 (-) Transcript_28006:3121-3723(-)